MLARESHLIDLFWLHVAFFKRWWGKIKDLIRLVNPNDLIGCGETLNQSYSCIGMHGGAQRVAQRHMWRFIEMCEDVCGDVQRGAVVLHGDAWRGVRRCADMHRGM